MHRDAGLHALRPRAAARCRGKHVFVEKPLAASSEGRRADRDADATTAPDVRHTFLYSPPVRAVRSCSTASELGELFFIASSRVNLGLHQRDVSVIWDLGPHDFSILLYWLDGDADATVRAVGRDSIVPGIADVAFIDARFPSGIVANVELSWLAPSKLRRTVIVGSEKMVVYEDGAAEPVRIFDRGVVYRDPETFGEYHLSYRTGDIVSPRVATNEPLRAELEDFVGRAVRRDAPWERPAGPRRRARRGGRGPNRSAAAGGETSPLPQAPHRHPFPSRALPAAA